MKKLLIIIALCTTSLLFAQKAGQTGELLKNEATKSDMQTYHNNLAPSANSAFNSKTTQDYTNTSTQNTYAQQNKKPQYNWHQNYGNAEVFLRIPEGGYYTVEVANQSISNATGKFRFFDLQPGRFLITIYNQGYLIYRSQLIVPQDNRLVLDFFHGHGLYLIDTYPIRKNYYGFNQWDDVWNNPYGNQPYFPGHETLSIMDDRSFSNFLTTLKENASFDRDKMVYIKQQATTTLFTAQQIKAILSTLSFDDQKVEAGKILYPRCIDVANFYQVYDSFDFESNKKKIMKQL